MFQTNPPAFISRVTEENQRSFRIPPYHYCHILDKNSNITRLEVGPQTFIRQDHESLVNGTGVNKMIIIPPNHYCVINNPVIRNEAGELVYDKHKQVCNNFGEEEVRLSKDFKEPFPLYPKEELKVKPTPLQVVLLGKALEIEALRDFKDADGVKRSAGEKWLFKGPATYIPRIEEKICCERSSYNIKEEHGLKLKALQNLTDSSGKPRKTGEEWIMRKPGTYLPEIYEKADAVCEPLILTDTIAYRLLAQQNFTDEYGIERKAGEQWLVTKAMSPFHIVDVYETMVKKVDLTVLSNNQYCVILNPVDPKTGKNRYGAKELRQGEMSFFLQPEEQLEENSIKNILMLSDEDALLLKAKEYFRETVAEEEESEISADKVVEHEPGDRWMVYGPRRYVPPIEVEVVERRRKIPMDKNEGIYVRDIRTGLVRSIIGEIYMLKAHEELWNMELPGVVEKIINAQEGSGRSEHKPYQVVSYRCSYNSLVQVYDYKKRTQRIVFGPELVMLGPDEQFTVKVLSGGKPKKIGVIETIELRIVVETSDHASLRIELSYGWYFKVDRNSQEDGSRVFAAKDFIGELCCMMASRIRGAVAAVDFDTFHKVSARIIRKAIFGLGDDEKIKNELVLSKFNLVVTNVDIKSVEPVDENTRLSLQKTVSMAIEITTNRQEATARHAAERLKQEASGELSKMIIEDKSRAEAAKKKLLELEAKSQSVQNQGHAIAEAKAKAQAEEIISQALLENAKLSSKARSIEKEVELQQKVRKDNLLLEHDKAKSELEIGYKKELAAIEAKKFQDMIEAIGSDTIVAMAEAGPEMQAQLLKGLGLQGFIVTDGDNPINLLNTAEGLIRRKDN